LTSDNLQIGDRGLVRKRAFARPLKSVSEFSLYCSTLPYPSCLLQARQARKEQAAENVRAERKHFQGSDYEDSEDESQDGEDDDEEEEEEIGWKEVDGE